ncbi:hypothetical protein IJI72_00450 [Candidatus Saccharibacteria bacterium]|nr:hypothetical protein [Candidatus Saccharibacteria bacterium]
MHLINQTTDKPRQVNVHALINATKEPISLYDDSTGSVVTFEPVERHQRRRAMASLRTSDLDDDCDGTLNAIYVMEQTMISRFRNAGGDIKNMAYVVSASCGRHDVVNPHVHWDGKQLYCVLEKNCGEGDEICRLILADDRTPVRLRNCTLAMSLYAAEVC